MPKTPARRRRKSSIITEPDPIVGGEPGNGAPAAETEGTMDLGQAIDWVRQALGPFDADTRKRIIRAANVLIK